MKYPNIREEELKNKVASDYFWKYDCTKIIGNVDFCVSIHQKNKEHIEQESLLWAEAKSGKSDIYRSLVQLILTIGKARTFDKYLPPSFLGAFDAEKIAFIPYNEIHEIFYMNDFNWNVPPSNYVTREFRLIHDKVKDIIARNTLLFYFGRDDKELEKFIRNNFIPYKAGISKIKIDKNNFVVIYNKWLAEVKPSIAVDWEIAKKSGIIDGDFYLADLLSENNMTLQEKLFVLLKRDHYELDRKIDEAGMFIYKTVKFRDEQVAHTQFWNKYERPPKEEYWDYIVERRDLLVPQDIRERKGSFFTPQKWVELSQKYIADVLGENWQDEYFVWDCAAGTGNLLVGLTNKYNIWASTLDQQDVDIMKERIRNGANLLEEHVFQFDFLNDDFSKLPASLRSIINDPKKRRKLIIYINPPYAEATTTKTVTGTGENKPGVTTIFKLKAEYQKLIGNATNEFFALFLTRIYEKLQNCILANFSKLKYVQGTNFAKFREFFKARFLGGFVVPAYTFDNVKGNFPIGFTIWNTGNTEKITHIVCDVYDEKANFIGKKTFYGNLPESINKWIVKFQLNSNDIIGLLSNYPPDFQNQNKVFIKIKQTARSGPIKIGFKNLIQISIYFAVRHCIEATWLNDRDQFLHPNNGWKKDKEFQNDCLAFTLFHSQNRISSKEGTNHWIPFTEYEVGAKDKFESDFMVKFINGKHNQSQVSEVMFFYGDSAGQGSVNSPLEFSPEAKAVFDAGREIWRYYHSQKFSLFGENTYNVNASLYDIREHFQGRNPSGKMNNKSKDEHYNELMENLRSKLKILARKIEPKVYKYGFLKY